MSSTNIIYGLSLADSTAIYAMILVLLESYVEILGKASFPVKPLIIHHNLRSNLYSDVHAYSPPFSWDGTEPALACSAVED